MCIFGVRVSGVVRNTIVTKQSESNGSPTLQYVYDAADRLVTVLFIIYICPLPTRLADNNNIKIFLYYTYNAH